MGCDRLSFYQEFHLERPYDLHGDTVLNDLSVLRVTLNYDVASIIHDDELMVSCCSVYVNEQVT